MKSPCLDRLAFGEADVLQHSGDLGADGHGLERRHRSQGVDGERHVAGYDRRHAHGLRRLRRSAGGLLPLGGWSGVLVLLPRERPPPRPGPQRSRSISASSVVARGAVSTVVGRHRRRRRALRDFVRFKGLVHRNAHISCVTLGTDELVGSNQPRVRGPGLILQSGLTGGCCILVIIAS